VILILQGQASQREVIQGIKGALGDAVTVYASHPHHRPEITGQADVAFREPISSNERVEWALNTAIENGIKLVHAGRKADLYEQRRADFEEAGIDLVTGALSMDTFSLENKSWFVEQCNEAGLSCVPAVTVDDYESLGRAVLSELNRGTACVKPETGIFGQGFWRLERDIDPFKALAHPDDRVINANSFLSMYAASPTRARLLVMPFLAGDETSVDVVCESGNPVAWVGRRKCGLYQVFERTGEAIDLALDAVRHFKCDGLVNVQTINDDNGLPHLLEINLRYSGGLSYTPHSGVNLPGIFAARRLGLPEPDSSWRDGVMFKPTTSALMLD